MLFKNEFEYELNGTTYYIEVEADSVIDDGNPYIELVDIKIFDTNGLQLNEDDNDYELVYQYALDYYPDVEEHSTNFDYYSELGAE